MSAPATATPPVLSNSPTAASGHLPINRSSQPHSSPQRSGQRVLTPVVVCGSPCVRPSTKEGLLSPLLKAAAASAAAAAAVQKTSSVVAPTTPHGVPCQNTVPVSESEKLTATNVYVLRELEKPRPRATDIESNVCPTSVEPFRKAWWAGVRPTTCERTCRHRSKVCDAIQLCNDCTGYYCKWLADLVGIPVLKASGRVDPVIFEKDRLAKLYWERISKVACCPKIPTKCLMCIRRYQLFTHFLPGNLDFRTLVHESVMQLHEEGFAVDMGLIRKVTRRHLECIASNMELTLPPEYLSSYQAYDIIVRRGPLVDVLATGLSSNSIPPPSPRGKQDSSYSPSSRQADRLILRQLKENSLSSSPSSASSGDSTLDPFPPTRLGLEPRQRRKLRRHSKTDDNNLGHNNRRSGRQVRKPNYKSVENDIYYEDSDFLALLDDHVQPDDTDDTDIERYNHKTRGKRKTKRQKTFQEKTTRTGAGDEDRYSDNHTMLPPSTSALLGFGLDDQFPPWDTTTTTTNKDTWDNTTTTTDHESSNHRNLSSSFEALVDQFRSSLGSPDPSEVSVDTVQVLRPSKKDPHPPQIPTASMEDYRQQATEVDALQSRLSSNSGPPLLLSPEQLLLLHQQLSLGPDDRRFSESQNRNHVNPINPADPLVKFDYEQQPSRLDLSNGSTFKASFDPSRSEPSRLQRKALTASKFASEPAVTDGIHRRELAEEARLGESGVRGVFWDPSRVGWCVLLPLIPSPNAELSTVKRKILCFSAPNWASFESAKWSAVYERLRRDPVELDFLTRDVREDLSNWVRENIELPSSFSPSHDECQNHHPPSSSYPSSSASLSGSVGLEQLPVDGNQLDPASSLLVSHRNLLHPQGVETGKLSELLGSLAKQIGAIGTGQQVHQLHQEETTTTTTGIDMDTATTTTGGASGGGEESQKPQHLWDADDSKQQHVDCSSSIIMGLLASLQAKLPPAGFPPQQQENSSVCIKAEEHAQGL